MNKVLVQTFRLRVKCSPSGHRRLTQVFGMCAEMYNACLDSWRGTYKWWAERHNPETEKFPADRTYSKYDLFEMLIGVRKDHPEWERLSVQVGRGVLTRWDRTKEAYFKRCREGENPGYPRFKPAHRWRSLEIPSPTTSMIVPPNTAKNQSAKWWRLQVKGLPRIRFTDQNHRLATALKGGGKLVELRVVRSPLRTEVHVVIKHPPRTLPVKKPVRPVGIDRGLNTRMALSDGTLIAPRNPHSGKIKRFQRLLSRSEKGSNSRKKKIRLVAKAYRRQKERAIQSDFRLAHRLTTEYDAFAVEVLNIAEMRRHPWVSKGFQKQRLADLARILEYKACKAGLQYRRVDAKGTSSTCSSCHHEQSTPQRVFTCRKCGLRMDKDVNAAKNIGARAFPGVGWDAHPDAMRHYQNSATKTRSPSRGRHGRRTSQNSTPNS